MAVFSHSSSQILGELLATANSSKEDQKNLLIKQSKSKLIQYLLQKGRITP